MVQLRDINLGPKLRLAGDPLVRRVDAAETHGNLQL